MSERVMRQFYPDASGIHLHWPMSEAKRISQIAIFMYTKRVRGWVKRLCADDITLQRHRLCGSGPLPGYLVLEVVRQRAGSLPVKCLRLISSSGADAAPLCPDLYEPRLSALSSDAPEFRGFESDDLVSSRITMQVWRVWFADPDAERDKTVR